MSLTIKRYIVAVLSLFFMTALLPVAFIGPSLYGQEEEPGPVVTEDNEGCLTCHMEDSPALVMESERSRHAQLGVGCFDCHSAEKGDVDAWEHEGVYVAALVTPLDCARCHAQEFEQFSNLYYS